MAMLDPHRFRIRLSLEFTELPKAISFAVAFVSLANRSEARAKAFRCDNSIEIISEGLSKNVILDLISAWSIRIVEEGGSQSISLSEAKELVFPCSIGVGEILHEKLTKRFLHSLPAGAWLLRAGSGNPDPHWIRNVGSDTDRQTLWEEARNSGVSNTSTYVLWSEADANSHAEYFSSFRRS
jgi:hypothetical protein